MNREGIEALRPEGMKALGKRATTLAPSHRRAFTLVEIVVVIAIILLLFGLLASVGTALWAKSEQRETQFTIKLLDQAIQEWQTSADRQITYGPNVNPPGSLNTKFDVVEEAYEIPTAQTYQEWQGYLLTNLLAIMSKTPQVSKIMAQISSEYLIPIELPDNPVVPLVIGGKHVQVKDPWGTPMRVVFPGRKWSSTIAPPDAPNRKDIDGTIITDAEERYGRCVNRQICFISAGPDLLFGNLDLGPTATLVVPEDNDPKSVEDNVYSYSLSREVTP